MVRRRRLLGITQDDLAITAGLSPSTIQKIEQNKTPNEGGNIGIDVLMRLALALRMEFRELMIAPSGNRYQRSVEFAAAQHHPASNPKLHDRSRTVRADGYRRLTGLHAAVDTLPVIQREESDADAVDAVVVAEPPMPIPTSFERDPSAE
jgi:transcriptional regulator with XRE-family HTH domain